MSYKCDIVEIVCGTHAISRWVDAYKSEKTANKVCDRLNAENPRPYEVYYEVVTR